MAKQIEDIIVKLGIQGFEGLDKIRSSFRDLSKVTSMSERDINTARASLFEFAKTAGNTEAVNKGLTSALQALRTQVDTCGNAYKQLTSDLNRLNEVSRGSTDAVERQRNALLRSADASAQNAKALERQITNLERLRQQTRPGSSAFAQLTKDIDNATETLGRFKSVASAAANALTQAPGASLNVATAQIAKLQAQMRTLTIASDEYLRMQTRISLVEAASSRPAARQQVRAAAEMFSSTQYQRYAEQRAANLELPDTTAALNVELGELQRRLENTVRGSSTYINTAIRMAEIQRQLRADVMGTSEAFKRLSDAEAGTERRSAKLADIQAYYASQGPLAPGVGGFRDPTTGAMIAAGARNPNRIRVNASAYPQPIGPQPFPEAAKQATAELERAYADMTRIQTRAGLERVELQAKFNQLQIDKLLEGLDLEGAARKKAFDTELADFDRRAAIADRRRGRRLTGMQLAQGVGAALSGGIFGGPEGLLGGLGGLAVGGVGGAFAGAAAGAQVGMFRQQLAQVTDYSARIDKLQIALRGIAGSQDAYSRALAAAASVTRDLNIPQETAIQGMTRLSAAVQGAGGTVSDSAFAFRAISEAVKATGGNAEQADGALLALTQVFSKGKVSAEELNQIAERLPGTFTLFAKAAGMTGPELQKALQEGKVGLNDLMKFLQLVSTNYGQTALKIAASSQEAGARLSVAFQNMQLEVGRALQPLGALLQDSFATFIRSTTPALVLAVKLIGGGVTNMYNAFASGIGILVDLRGVFENLAKTMLVFGGITAGVFVASNISTFTNALKGTLAVLRTLLSVEKALLVIENARIVAQTILTGLTAGATKGKIFGAVLGGAAGVASIIGIGKLVEGVIGDIEKGLSAKLAGGSVKTPELSTFASPAGGGGGSGNGTSQESALRKLQQNFDSTITQLGRQFNTAAKNKLYASVLQYEAQIQAAYKQGNLTLAEELKLKQKSAALDITEEVLRSEMLQLQDKLNEARTKGLDTQNIQNRIDAVSAELKQIQVEASKETTAELEKQAQKAKELKDALQQVFAPSASAEGIFNLSGIAQGYTFGEDDAFQGIGKSMGIERVAELGKELRALADPLAQVSGAAESIGSAFSTSFSSIITGASTAQQSLATFFNSVAASFLDMAAKIIAKWIQMTILNSLLNLIPGGRMFGVGSSKLDLPGLSGAGALSGGSSIAGATDWAAQGGGFFSGLKLNAMGNAYAANGIVPFAMGGIVTKPTLFKFASGGVPATGLMGEAGPEAIMPLRRLPNGRLGVEQAGGGTPVTVNVSVDASGTAVQGDAGQGEQLGRVVAQAVQAELIKQRRPGGLLNR